MVNIILLGIAGSGKSTLISKFSEWLKEKDLKASKFNFDCAADYLPYIPDFDIRKYFTLEKIMNKYKIGPNAALLKSFELISERKEEIKSEVEKIKSEINLIDVPGQLEIFIFSKGYELIDIFGKNKTFAIYLIPADISSISEIVLVQLLSLAARIKLEVPVINVISKADLSRINFEILNNPRKLKKELEKMSLGLEKEIAINSIKLVKNLLSKRIIKVSSITCEGFQDLLDISYEIFCSCGEI